MNKAVVTGQVYPTVAWREAALARAIFRRREPWTICGFKVEPDPAPAEMDNALAFEFAIGTTSVRLHLPVVLVDRLLTILDPAAPAAMGAAVEILVELALEPFLASLERMLDAIGSSVVTKPAQLDGEIQLGFSCCDDNARFPVRLGLNSLAQDMLLALLTTYTAMPAGRLPVSVPLSIRIGAADLLAHDIRRLHCGDVIAPWEGNLAGEVTCVAAEYICWSATSGENGSIVLKTAAALLPRSGKEGWEMDGTAKRGQGEPLVDANLDDLPIRVVFEVGRVEMTLADLSAMLPGYIIALGREAGSPIDILANGRRIGQGEVVTVGDSLGIRVLRLASAG